jgi:hypothetical protein
MRTRPAPHVRVELSAAAYARKALLLFLLGLLACWPALRAESLPTEDVPKHDRGYCYIHDVNPEVPWSMHVFKVARSHSELGFYTTLGKSNVLGMATVSEQLKSLPAELGQPIAAVNGDFYDRSQNYDGRPRDLQICRGELVSIPRGHTCFWIDPAHNVHMTNLYSRLRVIWPDGTATSLGLNEERNDEAAVLYTTVVGASTHTSRGLELVLENGTNNVWLPLRAGQVYSARVREVRTAGDSPLTREVMVLSLGPGLAERVPKVGPGTLLQVATEIVPDITGVNTAIGGGPALVRDGKPMKWSGLQWRHPRTAVGWNKDFILLVVVDGRQTGLSAGMTFTELADYMVKLGCEQAMNLDGGGSATLWTLGNVMSNPSEGHERPSANALVVVQTHAHTE